MRLCLPGVGRGLSGDSVEDDEGQLTCGPDRLGQAWSECGQDLYRFADVTVDGPDPDPDPDAERGGWLSVGVAAAQVSQDHKRLPVRRDAARVPIMRR